MTLLDVRGLAVDRSFDGSRRRAARTAGLGLLTTAVLAVPASVWLADGSAPAVRAAGATFVLVAVLDVVVGVALRRVLTPASARAASAAMWTRVGYGVAFGAASLALAVGADAAAVEEFQERWDVLLVLFGVHLLVVAGALTVRRSAPLPVSLATSLAGAAYVVDEVASRVFPDVWLGFLVPLMLGELVLAVWLVLRSRGPARPRPV